MRLWIPEIKPTHSITVCGECIFFVLVFSDLALSGQEADTPTKCATKLRVG